jgi:hypothetical protein
MKGEPLLGHLVGEAEDAGLGQPAMIAVLEEQTQASATTEAAAVVGTTLPWSPQLTARMRPRMLSSTMTLPTRIISGRSGIALAA